MVPRIAAALLPVLVSVACFAAEPSTLVLNESAYCRSYIQFGMDRVSPHLLKAEGAKVLGSRYLWGLKRSVKKRWSGCAPTGRCWGAGIPAATRAPIQRTWSSWPGASVTGSLKEAGERVRLSRRGAGVGEARINASYSCCDRPNDGTLEENVAAAKDGCAVYFPALGLSGATSTSTRPSSAITFFTWAPFPGVRHLIVTGPAT